MRWLTQVALVFVSAVAHAELVWENLRQDFQRRPEDAELKVNFTFRNDGKAPITISKITSSCGCPTAELPKMTFAPGESGALTSKFTFGGRRGMQAKSISVATDDGKAAQLSFQCLILDEPVVLSPAFVWWRVGEAADAKPVSLAIADPAKVHVIAVASSNPRITATLSPAEGGGKGAVRIQPADTAKLETAQIFVRTDFPPEGPKAYTIEVRIK